MLKTIGNNIRKYRKMRGWSQEKLAFESNLHRTYIGAVERGERNITIQSLQKISIALRASVPDLFKEFNDDGNG